MRSFYASFHVVGCVKVTLKVSFPATGCRKLTHVDDDHKRHTVSSEALGEEQNGLRGPNPCWKQDSLSCEVKGLDPWQNVPAVE